MPETRQRLAWDVQSNFGPAFAQETTEPFATRKRRLWIKVSVNCAQWLGATQSTISIEAVSVEHVAAALGQKVPRVTRRSYLARAPSRAAAPKRSRS